MCMCMCICMYRKKARWYTDRHVPVPKSKQNKSRYLIMCLCMYVCNAYAACIDCFTLNSKTSFHRGLNPFAATCIYIYKYISKYIYIHIYIYKDTHVYRCIHTNNTSPPSNNNFDKTCLHTYIHTYIHTYMGIDAYNIPTCIHTNTNTSQQQGYI